MENQEDSLVGKLPNELLSHVTRLTDRTYIGEEAERICNYMSLTRPISRGHISDWNAAEAVRSFLPHRHLLIYVT